MTKDDLRRRARYLLHYTAVNKTIANAQKIMACRQRAGFSRQIDASAGEEAVFAPIDTASDASAQLVDVSSSLDLMPQSQSRRPWIA